MKHLWPALILIVLLIGLGLYFSAHAVPVLPHTEVEQNSTTTLIASSTRIHLQDTASHYIIDAVIPQVQGHAHAAMFNTLAKQYVDRANEDFTRNVAEANLELPQIFKDQSHALLASADAHIVFGRFVSTVFNREYDMLAAAHPYHVIETLVYDLDATSTIELKDIFTDVHTALEYIASKAIDQIKSHLAAQGAGESFNPDGAVASEANYRLFTVEEKGMRFYFSEYQVAPYVAGAQEVLITWEDLRPLLTPEFKAFIK